MNLAEKIKKNPWIGWCIFGFAMVVVFLLGLLAASVTERRAEIASIYNNKQVEITGINPNNAEWGKNYPREYETWKKTKNTDFTSKHLGSSPKDVLEKHPEMVVLWAGYAFAKDYRAPKGHMHAIDDIQGILRTGTPKTPEDGPMPATCWSCKSPDVPRVMEEMGVENFYKGTWASLGSEIVNPIGCADCHDPETMHPTISRPALKEAFARQGKDITKASLQERRTLVCAQCHVEYYFKGDKNYLTFPWDNGMTVESMEEYYDKTGYKDWEHHLSRAPMLKAQHPDFELFRIGPHGQRGLSCADCHMPYKSEGGIKYSNHQITSPLANISTTCQTCHRESEDKLRNYVYEYQDKALEIRRRVEKELAKAHIMAKTAWDAGAEQKEMNNSLQLIRQAQWRWDFAVASHGGSFHAPVETQRILAHSLDRTMQAQMALQKILFTHGITQIAWPDLSTKEKAQAYIGLDMKKLNEEKKKWLQTVVPAWKEEAKNAGRL